MESLQNDDELMKSEVDGMPIMVFVVVVVKRGRK